MPQVSINLPEDVIRQAREKAKREKVRPDGLKQKPSAILRDWLLFGYREASREA